MCQMREIVLGGEACADRRPFCPELAAQIELLKEARLANWLPQAKAAADYLFESSRTGPEAQRNRDQIRAQGGIALMFEMLGEQDWEAKYLALSTLSELAFKNEKNCLAITSSENGLELIANVMLDQEDGRLQLDAALVLNNCAAFSEEACCIIVEHAKLVPALKELATGMHEGAKSVAVGAINCLSRCHAAKPVLLAQRVVEEALTPVLNETGCGEEHEARLARAFMAVSNLTGDTADCFYDDESHESALSTVVKIMEHAVEGEAWAGLSFSTYSALYPLRSLAANPDHRELLVEYGLLELLTRYVKQWEQTGQHADFSLLMALETAACLGSQPGGPQRLREAGMVQALKTVSARARGESDECAAFAHKFVGDLMRGHLAVWMAQHQRLGELSPLHQLDESVTGIILNQAFGGDICFYSMSS